MLGQTPPQTPQQSRSAQPVARTQLPTSRLDKFALGLAELQQRSPGDPLLLSHHAGLARAALLSALRQDAFHPARAAQPRGTGAAVQRHHQPQAPGLADDGLCSGASGERARPVAGRRHRLTAHVAAHRPGQGQQGPLRPAFAPAAGGAARVLAAGTARALAVPQSDSRPADDAQWGLTRLQWSQGQGRDRQARRDPHAAPLLRHRAPRGNTHTCPTSQCSRPSIPSAPSWRVETWPRRGGV